MNLSVCVHRRGGDGGEFIRPADRYNSAKREKKKEETHIFSFHNEPIKFLSCRMKGKIKTLICLDSLLDRGGSRHSQIYPSDETLL